MITQTVKWIICSVLVGVCSHGESDIDRNKAAEPMDDLTISRDVAYAPGDRHGLDVYVLREPSKTRPVVVYFYGGGWIAGAKADVAWVGAALARHGFIVVIPDYRIYPQGIWPMFLEDAAAAVRWARDHAANYGGNPSDMVLIGHSAGAYNAMSIGLDRQWLTAVGLDPRRDLRAIIGLSGVYVIDPDTPPQKVIFGPERQWPDTQPLNHVDGNSPPLLFITGDRDKDADPSDNDLLAAKVHEKGGTATVIHYQTFGHSETRDALAGPRNKTTKVLDDILRFLAAQGVAPSP